MLLIWKLTIIQTSLKTSSPSENKVSKHLPAQKLLPLENNNHEEGTFGHTAGLKYNDPNVSKTVLALPYQQKVNF